MVDVHCHLNFHRFEKDTDQVIKNAHADGVTKIINVGTKIDSSEQAVDLAQKYENLYAIVGVHPHHADKLEHNSDVILGSEATPESRTDSGQARLAEASAKRAGMTKPDWLRQLETLARMPKVVGIGEIGMDYFSYKSNDIVDPKLQKEIFIQQIELAHKLKLPLQIHNRQAGKDVVEILESYKSLLLNTPGMFHCFAGNMEILKKVLDLGFYVGFDGNITYNGLAPGEDTDLKDLAKYVPMDRIVVETDSPYLTPEPMRGSRNEPKYVIITAKFIAELKGINFQDFEAKTTENATKLFSL